VAPHRELDDAIEAILPLCAHFILQKPQGYDYHLGGKDNFAADTEMAARLS
jgi:hypothetical protein